MKDELTRVSVVHDVMAQIMRNARKERGLTQAAAAEQLRISQGRLSTYERGGAIPFERVVRMCRLYKLDIRWVAKAVEAVIE